MTEPKIVVTPVRAMVDVPRSIRAQGFSPSVAVQLRARLREADGVAWESQAMFPAGADGAIDLGAATPLSGDWSAPSAMAPIWAMRGSSDEPRARVLGPVSTAALHVELEARAEGAVAETVMVQEFLAQGVQRRDVREDGMVATLFTPGRAGPHPLVVVLAGSGGGLMERRAALFAAHGYVAMALGYFGAPGLPDHISGTRLEYFERALSWARRVLAPAAGFVALCGISRGAELSMLVASHYPALVSAVIAYVPSPVTHGVLNAGKPGEDRHAPAWSRGNQALPVLSVGNRTADWALFDEAPTPRAQTPALLSALADPDAVARAMIPIERMAGPLLMISGEDDALWPSTRFAEMARVRLAEAGFAHAGRFLQFEAWTLDTARHELKAPDGAMVELSGAEYAVLLAFLEHPQRVMTRDRILELSRNRIGDVFDRSVDVLVSRLRRKLGAPEEASELIKTVRGTGYLFAAAVTAQ